MSKQIKRAMNVPATATAGTAIAVYGLTTIEVQVIGLSSDTLQLQGSNNATDWIQIGSNLSAGITAVSKEWGYLRLNRASGTSDTITAHVIGQKCKKALRALEVKASVAAGAATYVGDLEGISAHYDNAGSQTTQLQGSMNGSTWTQISTDKTAEAQIDVSIPYLYLRCNTTVHASGAPRLSICGRKAARPWIPKALGTDVPLAAPSAPTITDVGDPDTETVTYKIVTLFARGHSAASSGGTTTTGTDATSASNYRNVAWSAVTGATGYEVWRTAGGGSQGLIATVESDVLELDDVDGDGAELAGDAATAPAAPSSASDAVALGDLSGPQVVVQGSMTGNLDLEASDDDGTTWIKIGSSITAAGATDVSTRSFDKVRLRWSAYTSGTPVAYLVGKRTSVSVPG